MKKLQANPNVEYLKTIEKDLFVYALNHPNEYVHCQAPLYGSHQLATALDLLYRFGWEYNEAYCEYKRLQRMNPKTPLEKSQEFIEKHPQWKDLYYYSDKPSHIHQIVYEKGEKFPFYDEWREWLVERFPDWSEEIIDRFMWGDD